MKQKTSFIKLIVLFILGIAFSFLINKALASNGIYLTNHNTFIDVFLFGVSGFVLFRGYKVRLFLIGKNPKLTGLQASKTLSLAKSSSLIGSCLAGLYAGGILSILTLVEFTFARNMVIRDVISIVLSLALMASGIVVEKLCELPPTQDAELPS
jgi:hypothetical protein